MALIEKQICRELQVLKLHGFINEPQYHALKPIGSHLPQLYGLPKTHKQGIPLRPILSMCGSPYHQLAKWLAHILEPVNTSLSKFGVKDSFELCETLDDINVKGKHMSSYVLFTNVIDFICHYVSINDIRLE